MGIHAWVTLVFFSVWEPALLYSTIVDLVWHFQGAFSAFILPHGRKLTSSFGTRGHLGDARFVSCFFTSLWRLADLTRMFLILNFRPGEIMRKGDGARFSLMPSRLG